MKDVRILVTGKIKKNIENVAYLGFLPREKYLKVLAKSYVGLCPIKDNKWTLPYVVFEFIGAKIPFLVSRNMATKALGDPFLFKDKEELLIRLKLLSKDYNRFTEYLLKLNDELKRRRKEGMDILKN